MFYSKRSDNFKEPNYCYKTFIPVYATPMFFHHTVHHYKHEFPSIFHPEDLFRPMSSRSDEERTNKFRREEQSSKFESCLKNRDGGFVMGYVPWVVHYCDSAESNHKEEHCGKENRTEPGDEKETFVVSSDDATFSATADSNKCPVSNGEQILSGTTLQESSEPNLDAKKVIEDPTVKSELRNTVSNFLAKLPTEPDKTWAEMMSDIVPETDTQEQPQGSTVRTRIRNKNRRKKLQKKKNKKKKN